MFSFLLALCHKLAVGDFLKRELKMHTVDSLLDAVKARHGITSDYKLARFIGKTQNTVANYRHGRSSPGDKTLSQLARLAEIPTEQVELLAVELHIARAQNFYTESIWKGISARLAISHS